jgi:nucleotide-binding universal stress UspA family protein
MNTIVVAAGESELGKRVLARAAAVADAFGAHLIVVSVADVLRETTVPGIVTPVGAISAPIGVAPYPAEPLETGLPPEELAHHRLEHARSQLASRQLDVEYVAEVGSQAERLLEIAERREADLIVVGSAERGFVDRLLGHDLGDRVAHRAKRDVLLVH